MDTTFEGRVVALGTTTLARDVRQYKIYSRTDNPNLRTFASLLPSVPTPQKNCQAMVERSTTTLGECCPKETALHCAEGRAVRVNFGDGKDAEFTSCIYLEESGRSGGGDRRKSVTGAMSLC